MAKVFLYPSNQWANRYAYGGTNEGEQMNAIADMIERALQGYDVTVFRSDNALDYIAGCEKVNAVSPDLCLCLHSNGYNGNVTGTETLYSPYVKGSKEWAQLVQNKIVSLMPSKDRGIINGTYPLGRNIGYMNRIKCPNCLVEIDYHDVPHVAEWIINNKAIIAAALAEAIVTYLGLQKKTAPAISAVFTEGDTVRVNTGARYVTGQYPAEWIFKSELYVRKVTGENVTLAPDMVTPERTGIFKASDLKKSGHEQVSTIRNDSAAVSKSPTMLTVATKLMPLWLCGGWNGAKPTTNIIKMPKGAKVELIEKTNAAWYKVRYNGKEGYASAQYLK